MSTAGKPLIEEFLQLHNFNSMDRALPKKKWPRKRIMMYLGIFLLVCLIVLSFYYTSGNSKLNVDTDRITISEIKKCPFTDNIPVNGVVLPLTSIYLDAIEGGRDRCGK